MLDSNIIIRLQNAAPRNFPGPEQRDGYLRPDRFMRDVGRREQLYISYVTLFEVIDPDRLPGSDPNRPMHGLDAARRSEMYTRLDLLKEFGIRVVGLDSEIFEFAMDLWFDSRQGRNPDKHDTALLDPIIAATAFVRGMQLLTVNVDDFRCFRQRYGLKLKSVVEELGYLKFADH